MSVALRAPGWWRALAYIVVGIAFSYGLSIGARAIVGYDPLLDGEAVATIGLIAVPFFFLVGLGCFDYWFYWAAGRPTRPDDHSGHGAYSWKDYFRPNTDYKVIGIQYVVTSFFFLFVGGLLAMLMRAELAAPGRQFVDANTFNGLFSVHASLLIAPLFFLIGLGAFDYWFYWAAGKPTRPEDHSGHGATSWRDYFRVNTDHKVIADGYQSGIMPGNYADTLPPAQLDALVKYLSEVTKGG